MKLVSLAPSFTITHLLVPVTHVGEDRRGREEDQSSTHLLLPQPYSTLSPAALPPSHLTSIFLSFSDLQPCNSDSQGGTACK